MSIDLSVQTADETEETEFIMPSSYLVQEGNGLEMLSRIELQELIKSLDNKSNAS